MNVLKEYEKYCAAWEVSFGEINDVKSYDDSVLFCPAGMQRFKDRYLNPSYNQVTCATSQKCLRLNDLESFGDGTHLIGLSDHCLPP